MAHETNRSHTIAYVPKLPPCDLHKAKHRGNVPAMYEGRTKDGKPPWAMMCAECFEKYGVGLGRGRGLELLVIDLPASKEEAKEMIDNFLTAVDKVVAAEKQPKKRQHYKATIRIVDKKKKPSGAARKAQQAAMDKAVAAADTLHQPSDNLSQEEKEPANS